MFLTLNTHYETVFSSYSISRLHSVRTWQTRALLVRKLCKFCLSQLMELRWSMISWSCRTDGKWSVTLSEHLNTRGHKCLCCCQASAVIKLHVKKRRLMMKGASTRFVELWSLDRSCAAGLHGWHGLWGYSPVTGSVITCPHDCRDTFVFWLLRWPVWNSLSWLADQSTSSFITHIGLICHFKLYINI